MTNKHTPTPWSNDGNVEISSGDRAICSMSYPYQDGQNAANAQLIAAAPELLEACEKALINVFRPSEIYDVLEAAIKKARGE